MKAILVATDRPEAGDIIRRRLSPSYGVDLAGSREACLETARRRHYEFVLVDLGFLFAQPPAGNPDYQTALQDFWQAFPAAEIIVMTSQEHIREAVDAVKAGASNYLTYPINPEEISYVMESIQESIRMQSELDYLRDRFWRSDSLEVIRTNSPAMKEIFNKVRSVAGADVTVLITGETGTGKGVLARLIHAHSPRSDSQFISVHCGGVPETILESELFGHEKGAFAGAVRRKLGKFEIARGGTIFLDEIGSVSPSMQMKLLQVVQDKSFSRLGGDGVLEADVRVIVATNEDLKRKADEGLFRRDLFYRLNVFPIYLPPLRDRQEDIGILVDGFIKKFNRLHSRRIVAVHPRVMDAFRTYSWPGNIRELENLIERAYILEKSPVLSPDSFPSEIFSDDLPRPRISPDNLLRLSAYRQLGIERIERLYLSDLLTIHRGSIRRSALAAGITSRQLYNLMTKHGLKKESFKSSPVEK